MGLHQRLLFEGIAMGRNCAATTDVNIVVLNAEVQVFASIRNNGIVVLTANLSGRARRAAATEAGRARL